MFGFTSLPSIETSFFGEPITTLTMRPSAPGPVGPFGFRGSDGGRTLTFVASTGDGGRPPPAKTDERLPPQVPSTPIAPDALNRLTA